MDKKEINEIIGLIKDIMEFSQEKNKVLIYFNDTFWKKLISICNTSSRDNINNLSELRELFNKYFELVTNTIKKGSLFDNAQELYKKDEFDIKLDKNIIEHIKHEKDISNIDIITFIMKEDPIYYTDKNKNKRDIIILDQIDFDNIDDEFIEAYKSFSFETIFKNKIVDFLKKLFDKVKNWKNFCNIYQLINDENIDKSKIKDLINLIFDTYDKLIKSQKNLISNLSEIELQKLIETLSDIAVFTYDNNINFFNKIEKLDEEIKDKIYIELYSKYNDEKHKEDIINKQVKKYYIKNLESGNMDRFISFIEKLNFDDNYKDIMDQINNTNKISENDFYATKENKNIILLCKLNDKKLIMKEDNIYFESCKPILESIYSEIDDTEDGKKIKFSQLKSLFNRKEENYIIEKFKLFTLIKENLDDNSVYLDDNSLYKKLKGIYEKINKALHDLKFISINFQKYFGKIYEKDIEKIKEYVSHIEEGSWNYYDSIQTDLIPILGRKNEADEIDKVKNFNLFNIIYKHTKGENQKIHFENAVKKLNNIKNILKSKDKENKGIIDEIKQNKSLIEEEIKKYFDQQKEDNELSLVFNFDSYEQDIKSIFYFFDNLHNDENWNKILCPKYKDLSRENIEQYLKELKEKKIYDYESERKSKSYYILFFKYLYQKQQAIDFLNQDHDNLNLLYEKLDPSKGMLGVKDIDDTISCVEFFSELKKFEQNEAIFNHIKDKFKGNEKLIESFKNFSDVHPTIIELNQSFDDLSLSLYDEVKLILKKAEIILE